MPVTKGDTGCQRSGGQDTGWERAFDKSVRLRLASAPCGRSVGADLRNDRNEELCATPPSPAMRKEGCFQISVSFWPSATALCSRTLGWRLDPQTCLKKGLYLRVNSGSPKQVTPRTPECGLLGGLLQV